MNLSSRKQELCLDVISSPRGRSSRKRRKWRTLPQEMIPTGSLWHTFVTPKKQFLHNVDQTNFRKCSIHVSCFIDSRGYCGRGGGGGGLGSTIARKRDSNRGVLGRGGSCLGGAGEIKMAENFTRFGKKKKQ